MTMKSVNQKVLGGFRIKLPKEYADDNGIKIGDVLILERDGKRLTIIPAEVVPR